MRNSKLIIGFAAFGFLLSFISGIASRIGPGLIFLHALIFAVVFALLAVGIQVVFDRVLSADAVGGEPVVADSGQPVVAHQSTHKVDFYVEDETLPSDESAPHFYVANAHNIFSEMEEKSKAVAKEVDSEEKTSSNPDSSVASSRQGKSVASTKSSSSSSSSEGFVPISLGETPATMSGTESKHIEDLSSFGGGASSVGSDADELDELPSLDQASSGSLGDSSSTSSAREEQNDEDDDDNVGSGYVPSSGGDANEFAKGQDAAVMAKAISTLLARE